MNLRTFCDASPFVRELTVVQESILRIRRWQPTALANSSLTMAAEALSRMGWPAT